MLKIKTETDVQHLKLTIWSWLNYWCVLISLEWKRSINTNSRRCCSFISTKYLSSSFLWLESLIMLILPSQMNSGLNRIKNRFYLRCFYSIFWWFVLPVSILLVEITIFKTFYQPFEWAWNLFGKYVKTHGQLTFTKTNAINYYLSL